MNISLVLALLVCSILSCGRSQPDAFIVGSVGKGVSQAQTAFLMSGDSDLTLSGVIREGGRYLSSLNSFEQNGTLVEVAGPRPEGLYFSWYIVKPRLREYSNLWKRSTPGISEVHLDPIEYIKIPLPELMDKGQITSADLNPSRLAGTYYVGIEVSGSREESERSVSAFEETSPLHYRDPFRIVQIVRREDDTYLGYLSELFQTPFVIAPRMTEAGVHETDARMGSDCAGFAIYGKRRQGFHVPYCGPRGIYDYLDKLCRSPLSLKSHGPTEIYVDSQGQPIEVGKAGVQPGDIVHFGEQVSVFYQDSGIPGQLDKEDLLIQSWGSQPHITTFANSGFFHLPPRIFKWKNSLQKRTIDR